MDLPPNINLPFFAYGVFKPGELAFLKIKSYIKMAHSGCNAYGELLIRDGIPIFNRNDYGNKVFGFLLEFNDGESEKAYEQIVDLEPDLQYIWDTQPINMNELGQVKANILQGRNPTQGAEHFEYPDFSSRNDPLLHNGIQLIPDLIDEVEKINAEGKDEIALLRLQMAYMLLWTILERYATLRYQISMKKHKKDRTRSPVMYKIHKIAEDPAFAKCTKKYVKRSRSIVKADEPESKKTLDPEDPKKSINYYYAMRSNITHRGKAHYIYYRDLLLSIKELYKISKKIIRVAFKESSS